MVSLQTKQKPSTFVCNTSNVLGLKNLFLALILILVTKRVTIVMWVQCTLINALLKIKVKLCLTVIRSLLSYLGSRSRLVGFSNLMANFNIAFKNCKFTY